MFWRGIIFLFQGALSWTTPSPPPVSPSTSPAPCCLKGQATRGPTWVRQGFQNEQWDHGCLSLPKDRITCVTGGVVPEVLLSSLPVCRDVWGVGGGGEGGHEPLWKNFGFVAVQTIEWGKIYLKKSHKTCPSSSLKSQDWKLHNQSNIYVILCHCM